MIASADATLPYATASACSAVATPRRSASLTRGTACPGLVPAGNPPCLRAAADKLWQGWVRRKVIICWARVLRLRQSQNSPLSIKYTCALPSCQTSSTLFVNPPIYTISNNAAHCIHSFAVSKIVSAESLDLCRYLYRQSNPSICDSDRCLDLVPCCRPLHRHFAINCKVWGDRRRPCRLSVWCRPLCS